MAKICYLLTSCMVQVLLAKHEVKNNVNSWAMRRVQHIQQQRGSAVKQIRLLKTVNKSLSHDSDGVTRLRPAERLLLRKLHNI